MKMGRSHPDWKRLKQYPLREVVWWDGDAHVLVMECGHRKSYTQMVAPYRSRCSRCWREAVAEALRSWR